MTRWRHNMSGIRIFKSVEEAQAAGFSVYERIPEGYLVRKSSGTAFALAIVKLVKSDPEKTGQDKDGSTSEREPANHR